MDQAREAKFNFLVPGDKVTVYDSTLYKPTQGVVDGVTEDGLSGQANYIIVKLTSRMTGPTRAFHPVQCVLDEVIPFLPTEEPEEIEDELPCGICGGQGWRPRQTGPTSCPACKGRGTL